MNKLIATLCILSAAHCCAVLPIWQIVQKTGASAIRVKYNEYLQQKVRAYIAQKKDCNVIAVQRYKV